jgi:hypothetical protein
MEESLPRPPVPVSSGSFFLPSYLQPGFGVEASKILTATLRCGIKSAMNTQWTTPDGERVHRADYEPPANRYGIIYLFMSGAEPRLWDVPAHGLKTGYDMSGKSQRSRILAACRLAQHVGARLVFEAETVSEIKRATKLADRILSGFHRVPLEGFREKVQRVRASEGLHGHA